MTITRLKLHTDDLSKIALSGKGVSDIRLYGVTGVQDTAHIGNRVADQVERLSVSTSTVAFDFLTIALAVTAADSITPRQEFGEDGWARVFDLDIPLVSPATWMHVKERLEKALGFLSGDVWTLNFRASGRGKPSALNTRKRRVANLNGVDVVSLFSGGMDSWIGVTELVQSGRVPLLVSHAYTGDRGYQNSVAASLKGRIERFPVNASPIRRFAGHDTTMRTRSFNFIAFAAVAADSVASLKTAGTRIPLHVPENGFIALNAPLTHRRLGSLSTRTTHPHYLTELQTIFDEVGLASEIENPYRHKTKGQMLATLKAAGGDTSVAVKTVSCGKWKRKNIQCGHCVPCIIRKSSFLAAGVPDDTPYGRTLTEAIDDYNIHLKDDVMAMAMAVQPASQSHLRRRALSSGPLPQDPVERKGWFDVHEQGLYEVANYLRTQGVIT